MSYQQPLPQVSPFIIYFLLYIYIYKYINLGLLSDRLIRLVSKEVSTTVEDFVNVISLMK
jgi:hypothetical protein